MNPTPVSENGVANLEVKTLRLGIVSGSATKHIAKS